MGSAFSTNRGHHHQLSRRRQLKLPISITLTQLPKLLLRQVYAI
jgi:hypothetical protein